MDRPNIHGRWLAWYRARRACTWAWLSKQIDVSATMIHRYLAGEGRASEGTWRRIAEFMGGRMRKRPLSDAEYWGGPPPFPPPAGWTSIRDAVLAWATQSMTPDVAIELSYLGWAGDEPLRVLAMMQWHGLLGANMKAKAITAHRLIAMALDMEGNSTFDNTIERSRCPGGPADAELDLAIRELIWDARIASDQLVLSLLPRDAMPRDAEDEDRLPPSWAGDSPGPRLITPTIAGRTAAKTLFETGDD